PSLLRIIQGIPQKSAALPFRLGWITALIQCPRFIRLVLTSIFNQQELINMKTRYNSMRISYLVLGVLFTALIAGCGKDWLGGNPLGRWTEDDMPEGSLEGQVFGIYAGLRKEGTSGLPYVAIHNIRADDANIGGGTGDEAGAGPIFDDFGYSTNYWLINNYWSDHYAIIALANNLLNDADSLETPTELTAINVAEAKFVRAFAYFNLV